jgi:hypothetical protein
MKRHAVVAQFEILFAPRLQPGDPQTMRNSSSRFNGFRTSYERKPLKRFFISKSLLQSPG